MWSTHGLHYSRQPLAHRAQVHTTYADEWVEDFLDSHTAVVVLSHDPKIDDPGLEAAQAAIFYIGALGSRRSHAARRHGYSSGTPSGSP